MRQEPRRQEVVALTYFNERLPVKEKDKVYEHEEMALQFPISSRIDGTGLCFRRNE
jgi:hypothetical protein